SDDAFRTKMQRLSYPDSVIDDALERMKAEFASKRAEQVVQKTHNDYIHDRLTRNRAKGYLSGAITNEELVDLAIAQWDLEKEEQQWAEYYGDLRKIKDDKVKIIHKCYESNHINVQVARIRLAEIDIQQDLIDEYISLWDLERFCSSKSPTKSEL